MPDPVAKALADPIIPAIGLAVSATVAALWLAAAWWAYRDAARRTGTTFAALLAAAWIVLSSPFLMPLALAVYVMARPQHTAAEHRSRRLVKELVDELDPEAGSRCPGCGTLADEAWLRCPECSTWLARPCAHCGGWSDRDIDVCPWCGSEERAEPVVEQLRPVDAPVVPRKRRGRQPWAPAVASGGRDPRKPKRRLATTDRSTPRLGSR